MRLRSALCCGLTAWLCLAPVHGQVIKHQSGQNLVPVFEGWQRNGDGSYTFHLGYLNRNYQERLDVPVGPNNRFEPGPVDRGQPTHFYTRRHEFVFSGNVPKDWDTTRRLQWILVINGKTETANGWLQPEWEVDDGVIQMNLGPGGAPPAAPPNRHPQVTAGSREVSATVGALVALSVEATDDSIPRPRKPPSGCDRAAGPAGTAGSLASLSRRRPRGVYAGAERAGARGADQRVNAGGLRRARRVPRARRRLDGLLETPHDISVTLR